MLQVALTATFFYVSEDQCIKPERLPSGMIGLKFKFNQDYRLAHLIKCRYCAILEDLARTAKVSEVVDGKISWCLNLVEGAECLLHFEAPTRHTGDPEEYKDILVACYYI